MAQILGTGLPVNIVVDGENITISQGETSITFLRIELQKLLEMSKEASWQYEAVDIETLLKHSDGKKLEEVKSVPLDKKFSDPKFFKYNDGTYLVIDGTKNWLLRLV